MDSVGAPSVDPAANGNGAHGTHFRSSSRHYLSLTYKFFKTMVRTPKLTAAATAPQTANTGTVRGIVRETGTGTGTGIETGTGTEITEIGTAATAKGANESATAAGAETEDMNAATGTVRGIAGIEAGVVIVIEKEGAVQTVGRNVVVPRAGKDGHGEVQAPVIVGTDLSRHCI